MTSSEDDDINYGGGALFLGSESVLDIANSTVVGNISQWVGGGIYLSSRSPAKSIINVTVSGNSAVKAGGGIYQTLVAWAPSACSASLFMPSRPLTCVAIFSSTNYNVSTVVGGTGTGTVTGAGNYAAGAKVTLKATPTAGSTFVGWSPAPCAASFVMPNRPIVCAAIFN